MHASAGPCLGSWQYAVCTRASMPPLQPGEHMTVGQVRHPELYSAFEMEFERWYLDTNKKIKKFTNGASACPFLVACGVQNVSLGTGDRLLTVAEREAVERQVAQMLGWNNITVKQLKGLLKTDSRQLLQLALRGSRRMHHQQQPQQDHSMQQRFAVEPSGQQLDAVAGDGEGDIDWRDAWFELKCDSVVNPAVMAGTVSSDDERTKLRGGKGIWAAQDVPAAHVLGPYRHYCMYNNTYNHMPVPSSSWKSTPLDWRLQLESYCCTDDATQLSKEGEPGTYSLIYSGWGYGNETAYANDPHVDPIANLSSIGKADEEQGPCIKGPDGQELHGNVMCGVVKILGWPYMFMFTHHQVPAGREFLYEYGYSYWNIIKHVLELKEWQDKVYRLEAQSSQVTSGLTTSIQAAIMSRSGTAANGTTAAASGLTSIGKCMTGMQLRSKQKNLQAEQAEQEAQGSAPWLDIDCQGEDDDASLALAFSPQADLSTALAALAEQQCKLEGLYLKRQSQREVAARRQDGTHSVKTVLRINKPEAVQMMRDAEVCLSRELLKFPQGIMYKKLANGTWWNKQLEEYEYDQWEFIKRRSLYFRLANQLYSPNTTVSLTDEWRQVLLQQYCEDQNGQGTVHQAATATPTNRPKRQRVVETIITVQDKSQERELQVKRVKLEQAKNDMQQLKQELVQLRAWLAASELQKQQLQQQNEQLLRIMEESGVQLPAHLLLPPEADSTGGPMQETNAAAAGRKLADLVDSVVAAVESNMQAQQVDAARGDAGQADADMADAVLPMLPAGTAAGDCASTPAAAAAAEAAAVEQSAVTQCAAFQNQSQATKPVVAHGRAATDADLVAYVDEHTGSGTAEYDTAVTTASELFGHTAAAAGKTPADATPAAAASGEGPSHKMAATCHNAAPAAPAEYADVDFSGAPVPGSDACMDDGNSSLDKGGFDQVSRSQQDDSQQGQYEQDVYQQQQGEYSQDGYQHQQGQRHNHPQGRCKRGEYHQDDYQQGGQRQDGNEHNQYEGGTGDDNEVKELVNNAYAASQAAGTATFAAMNGASASSKYAAADAGPADTGDRAADGAASLETGQAEQAASGSASRGPAHFALDASAAADCSDRAADKRLVAAAASSSASDRSGRHEAASAARRQGMEGHRDADDQPHAKQATNGDRAAAERVQRDSDRRSCDVDRCLAAAVAANRVSSRPFRTGVREGSTYSREVGCRDSRPVDKRGPVLRTAVMPREHNVRPPLPRPRSSSSREQPAAGVIKEGSRESGRLQPVRSGSVPLSEPHRPRSGGSWGDPPPPLDPPGSSFTNRDISRQQLHKQQQEDAWQQLQHLRQQWQAPAAALDHPEPLCAPPLCQRSPTPLPGGMGRRPQFRHWPSGRDAGQLNGLPVQQMFREQPNGRLHDRQQFDMGPAALPNSREHPHFKPEQQQQYRRDPRPPPFGKELPPPTYPTDDHPPPPFRLNQQQHSRGPEPMPYGTTQRRNPATRDQFSPREHQQRGYNGSVDRPDSGGFPPRAPPPPHGGARRGPHGNINPWHPSPPYHQQQQQGFNQPGW